MARPRLPLDERSIIAAYQAGDTIPTIARRMGIDRSRITRLLRDQGLYRDQRGAHWAQKREAS